MDSAIAVALARLETLLDRPWPDDHALLLERAAGMRSLSRDLINEVRRKDWEDFLSQKTTPVRPVVTVLNDSIVAEIALIVINWSLETEVVDDVRYVKCRYCRARAKWYDTLDNFHHADACIVYAAAEMLR